MLRLVALVRTDVSEERSTSIIRVKRIGELGTSLAVTSNQRELRRNTIGLLNNIPLFEVLMAVSIPYGMRSYEIWQKVTDLSEEYAVSVFNIEEEFKLPVRSKQR
jgi:sulfite reductase beta subunit-like hemoprotein